MNRSAAREEAFKLTYSLQVQKALCLFEDYPIEFRRTSGYIFRK